MKKILAKIAAPPAYRLALLVVNRASDAWLVRNLGRARSFFARRRPDDLAVTALGDLIKIFQDPAASLLARRLIREARPAQFKAVVRGALR